MSRDFDAELEDYEEDEKISNENTEIVDPETVPLTAGFKFFFVNLLLISKI